MSFASSLPQILKNSLEVRLFIQAMDGHAAVVVSPMMAVMELGELVDHILSLCEGETLWAAAQVCSSWRQLVLRRHRNPRWPTTMLHFPEEPDEDEGEGDKGQWLGKGKNKNKRVSTEHT